MPRWIGLDYGTRRIGVAVSDFGARLASPERTLAATGLPQRDAQAVLTWAADQEPGGFVVGLPLNMDGSDSEQTRHSRTFAAALAARTELPVELWDERLSSFQADEIMLAAEVRKSRRKALRDALAAQVILQSFLDARRAAGEPPSDSPPPPAGGEPTPR